MADLTPQAFAEKWAKSKLSERSAYQQHFLDLFGMLGQPSEGEHPPAPALEGGAFREPDFFRPPEDRPLIARPTFEHDPLVAAMPAAHAVDPLFLFQGRPTVSHPRHGHTVNPAKVESGYASGVPRFGSSGSGVEVQARSRFARPVGLAPLPDPTSRGRVHADCKGVELSVCKRTIADTGRSLVREDRPRRSPA